MVKPLLARLSKLEEHFDVRGATDRGESMHRRMRLIMSDPTAYELASQCDRTVEKACEGKPELQALRGDFPALIQRLDDDTLLQMENEAQRLEDRLDWLRQHEKDAC